MENKFKYTLAQSGNMSNRINAVDENGKKLFVIEIGYDEDKRTDRKIVSLVKAAPELLEALLYARQWVDGQPASQFVLEKIDSAINKATNQ